MQKGKADSLQDGFNMKPEKDENVYFPEQKFAGRVKLFAC